MTPRHSLPSSRPICLSYKATIPERQRLPAPRHGHMSALVPTSRSCRNRRSRPSSLPEDIGYCNLCGCRRLRRPFLYSSAPTRCQGQDARHRGGAAISECQPLSALQIDLFRLGAHGKGTGKDGDDRFPILRRIDPEDGRSIGTDGCVRGIDREGLPPGPGKLT